MLILFVFLSAFFSTGTSQQCAAGATENIAVGCRTYYRCVNGVGTLVVCADVGAEFVYNSATGHCDDPHNVAPPCGQQKDCTNKGDRSYADKDNHCHSYYTCNRGTFFGHTICAPSLVFDESSQTCNWPQNVVPPCGTKTT